MNASPERRLAAILSADVVGYSRLLADDEDATVRTLKAYCELVEAMVIQHRGTIDITGDNFLARFPSALDAVQCAVEIQRELHLHNANLPDDRKLRFRIGAHLGDIREDDGRVYGDGINIAARLEPLADPGGICVSEAVHAQVHHRVDVNFDEQGIHTLKNIPDPVRVYKVRLTPGPSQGPRSLGPRWVLVGSALAATVLAVTGVLLLRNRTPASSPSRALEAKATPAPMPAPTAVASNARTAAPAPEPAPSPARTMDAAPEPALAVPFEKSTLAVLPFTNMSGDPEQEYFADGLTEDLITDLAKLRTVYVIARTSAFYYKGRALPVQDIARELRVQYIVEGSVRRADDRVRITAQLIDGGTGYHIWSERYDRSASDLFTLQDEVLAAIGTALQKHFAIQSSHSLASQYEGHDRRAKFKRVQSVRVQKPKRPSTDNLEAYDYYLRGKAHVAAFSRDGNEQARELFTRAVVLDPDYAAARAEIAWTYLMDWVASWNDDPQTLTQAETIAMEALTGDETQPRAHGTLAFVHVLSDRPKSAITQALEAMRYQPDAWAYSALGNAFAAAGEIQRAIERATWAARLDPHNPVSKYVLGKCYCLQGRYDEARTHLQRATQLAPDFIPPYVLLAFADAELGRQEEAAAAVADVFRINPNYSVQHTGRVVEDPAMAACIGDLLSGKTATAASQPPQS